MFDRYTEDARRAIFFARYEVSNFGATEIDTSHILLGALRENSELFATFLIAGTSIESMRNQIVSTLPESQLKVSTSIDVPLSEGATEVLAHAARESKLLGDDKIRMIHLLLSLIQDPVTGPLLNAHAITRDRVFKHAQSTNLPSA